MFYELWLGLLISFVECIQCPRAGHSFVYGKLVFRTSFPYTSFLLSNWDTPGAVTHLGLASDLTLQLGCCFSVAHRGLSDAPGHLH